MNCIPTLVTVEESTLFILICNVSIISDEHRPIVHPFTCPLNRFHVTSLDFRMLPSLTTILLDLMFYSK